MQSVCTLSMSCQLRRHGCITDDHIKKAWRGVDMIHDTVYAVDFCSFLMKWKYLSAIDRGCKHGPTGAVWLMWKNCFKKHFSWSPRSHRDLSASDHLIWSKSHDYLYKIPYDNGLSKITWYSIPHHVCKHLYLIRFSEISDFDFSMTVSSNKISCWDVEVINIHYWLHRVIIMTSANRICRSQPSLCDNQCWVPSLYINGFEFWSSDNQCFI